MKESSRTTTLLAPKGVAREAEEQGMNVRTSAEAEHARYGKARRGRQQGQTRGPSKMVREATRAAVAPQRWRCNNRVEERLAGWLGADAGAARCSSRSRTKPTCTHKFPIYDARVLKMRCEFRVYMSATGAKYRQLACHGVGFSSFIDNHTSATVHVISRTLHH